MTAHAEMQVITAAASALGGKYLNECNALRNLGTVCDVCGGIGWAQVKRLVYGATDEKEDTGCLHRKPYIRERKW